VRWSLPASLDTRTIAQLELGWSDDALHMTTVVGMSSDSLKIIKF
jgi:hypothetical protein